MPLSRCVPEAQLDVSRWLAPPATTSPVPPARKPLAAASRYGKVVDLMNPDGAEGFGAGARPREVGVGTEAWPGGGSSGRCGVDLEGGHPGDGVLSSVSADYTTTWRGTFIVPADCVLLANRPPSGPDVSLPRAIPRARQACPSISLWGRSVNPAPGGVEVAGRRESRAKAWRMRVGRGGASGSPGRVGFELEPLGVTVGDRESMFQNQSPEPTPSSLCSSGVAQL